LPEHPQWEEFSERYWHDDPILATVYHTLGEIGPAARNAVPDLAANAWHCEAAFDALDRIQPDPLEVLANINTDEYDEVREGIGRIVQMDRTKTGALKHAVRHYTGQIRYAAADALAEMGPEAADTVPAITEALLNNTEWDRDTTARWFLINALTAIGESARSAVSVFRAALAKPDVTTDQRIEIGVVLARLGDTKEGWAVLQAALATQESEGLAATLPAVSAVASQCEEAVQFLFATLRSPTAAVRQASSRELLGLSCGHSWQEDVRLEWVPDLLTALTDPSPQVQWHITRVLGRVGEANTPIESKAPRATRSSVIDALIRLIGNCKQLGDEHEDRTTRSTAVEALTHWGPLPASAEEPLRRYAARQQNANETERITALLARIQPKS
jgi:HEAT repeat protein